MSAKDRKEQCELLALIKAAFPYLGQGDKEALKQLTTIWANRGIAGGAA